MSDIRFNRWLHQSGTGGVYQDSSGRVGIGTSVPTTALDVQSGSIKIGSNTLSSSGVSTFTTVNATTVNATSLVGITTAGITTVHATNIVGVTTAGITSVYTNSVNDGPLAGFRNFIINGNMAISQRGTSFSTINTYNLDRYRTFGGPITHTITQQDSIATYSPSRYALRAARNSGATETNELGIAQGIESQNSYALRGKTVTLSFRARCGANFSSASSSLRVRIFTGTGTDENPVSMTGMNGDVDQTVTLTTSLQSFAVTGTLSASLTQATVTFAYTATGTAGANDWFEITDVQLEIGNRATPFERRSYGQELALCQRYYQKYTQYGASGYIEGSPANTAALSIYSPVELRTSPSVSCTTASSIGVERGTLYGINNTAGGVTWWYGSQGLVIFNLDTTLTRWYVTWCRIQNLVISAEL